MSDREDVYGMDTQNIAVVVDPAARQAADEAETFHVEKAGKAGLFSNWQKMSDDGAIHDNPKSRDDKGRCKKWTIVILAILVLIFMTTTIVLATNKGGGGPSTAAVKQQKIAAAMILSSHLAPGNTAEARALGRALELAKEMGETDLIMSPLSETVTALSKNSYWPFDIRGFEDRVESVSFSPDGKLLAAGSGDNTIKITPIVMDRHSLLPTVARSSIIDCHDHVDKVAWSPSGSYLAAACNGVDSKGNIYGGVKVWSVQIPVDDVADGKYDLMYELKHSNRVHTLAWSPTSDVLTAGDDDGFLKAYLIAEAVTNGKEPEMMELMDDDFSIRGLDFSPDGEQIAIGTTENIVILLDVSDMSAPEMVANGTMHRGDVTTVAFSPGGSMLVSGSNDGTIYVYDMDNVTGELTIKHTLPPHDTSVQAVTFGSPTLFASTGYDSTVRIYEVVNPGGSDERIRLMETLHQPNIKFNSLSFVDGEFPMIAAGTRSPHALLWTKARDLGIRGPQFFKLQCSQELKRKFGEGVFEVRAADWNAESTLFAASSVQGYVCIWESARPGDDRWNLIAALQIPGSGERHIPARSIKISPDNSMVAVGTDRAGVHVWKRDDAVWGLVREHFQHTNDVNVLAWSPDSQFLASGSEDNLVGVWPVQVAGSDPTFFHGHRDDATALAFYQTKDDRLVLATGSSDQTIRLYELAPFAGEATVEVLNEDKLLGQISGVEHLEWSVDGKLACSGNDGVVKIYGELGRALQPEMETTLESRSGVVWDLTWAPKGDRLAASMSDGTVHVWYPVRAGDEVYDDWTQDEKCEGLRWMTGTHDRLACHRPSKIANGILPRYDDPAYDHFMQFLLVDLREMEALMEQFAYGKLDKRDIDALGYGDVESVALP